MWGFLLAWLNGRFVLPWRPAQSTRSLAGAIGWLFVFFVVLGAGMRFAPIVSIPLILSALLVANVAHAYRTLERAAHLPLDDPKQAPADPPLFMPYIAPTAMTLSNLARAVDASRRGQSAAAKMFAERVRRDLLRAAECRLLEGTRALATRSHGDEAHAARKAIAALPTGCEDLDAELGRLAVKSAWGIPFRLDVIDRAWSEAGVPLDAQGTLSRLRRLIAVHLADDVETAPRDPDELRAIAHEARAIGDEVLARALEAEIRRASPAYR